MCRYMEPTVPAKIDLPPVPPALADVALLDGPTCAATAGVSISNWLDLVRRGEAPSPVIRQTRFTRWRMADVRAWLMKRTAQPVHDAAVIERATATSARGRTPEAVAKGIATRKAKIKARTTAQAGA